ncbi:MAG TPA: hypothetical protein PLP33_29530 [Leptospiraceae bacterium]|nr:hypothetical protein [Leptospiraceae bacterium]
MKKLVDNRLAFWHNPNIESGNAAANLKQLFRLKEQTQNGKQKRNDFGN